MKNLKTATLLIALMSLTLLNAAEKVKVACVGNSITYGYGIEDRDTWSYPSQLQRMLGDAYEVGNFGHSGATLLRHGHKPYFKTPEFKQALDFAGDIAVIHLGVNDTDPRNWPNYNAEFVGDYLALIDSLRAVNPQVRIILAELSPLRAGHHRFETGTRDWRLEIQDAIRNVAKIAGVELIDFNQPLRDRQNLIFDNVHPDALGAQYLAETAYRGITGDYGGLSLPPVWQSGMVVQRNRPLLINGTADAGSPITLTLDNRSYHALTDNRGQWSITTAPLVTGPEYTLTVSDGKTTIKLDDILAGEVWLALGQSNMEFYLDRAIGGKETADNSTDPMFRFLDMKEIARTDDILWSDSIVELMDDLKHYRPATWQQAMPETSAWLSAVGYWFGRNLRDSLNVPVGIISAPVGGSPAESWIDINTIEANVPRILINPTGNDYLQPWVQKRIKDNLGDRFKTDLHPYLPGYLFASAIRPLQSFPVAGAIWYQGESNAHNPELHSRLFPLMIDSWRREFKNDTLPVYFVQLSSMNRPSWADFRDSQRRLALEIPNVGMAVSHDHGHKTDVHPKNKKPVGERLARLALNRTYGFDIEDQGPTPVKAFAHDGMVTITFDHADGLKDKNADTPQYFEIAETEGLYFPADAEINDNTITLKSMNVSKPRYVRYAWQPFTKAALINSDSLPASTFKLEVDNAAGYDMEPGYEKGVSAMFAGTLGNNLIVAGGCNFPDDPMGPISSKKSYQGIYAASADNPVWQRVGSLPEPTAYGMSADVYDGLFFGGGVTPDGPTTRTMLFNESGLHELPPLPVPIDNAYAAGLRNVVYIAGGNVNGKPSNTLYALDMENLQAGWKKLKSFPGNPRVQPVLAASMGNLYMWGGFAGKHDGKDATLETSGLMYDPAKNKWSPIATPRNADGEEISLGGGAAATFIDGPIVVAGGVNKDVFLEALQNQAPDYLQHPIDWYAFNKNVMVYFPGDNTWRIEETIPDAARAGAAIMTILNTVYIYGGELKPRIRTAETIVIGQSEPANP